MNRYWIALLSLALTAGIGNSAEEAVPDLIAANAFYYYEDVERAHEFYRDTLGLETVIDYGFAKIMRITTGSYVTVVDAELGMHSADEPKTITLSLVTDELDAWRRYLEGRELALEERMPDDGAWPGRVVIADPEGYLLVFVENAPEHSMFAGLEPVATKVPSEEPLMIRAGVFSAYFEDLAKLDGFYERLLGVAPAGELDGAVLLQVALGGFVGLVDGGDHLHEPTTENGFTLSFFTNDVDAWFTRAAASPGLELRTEEVVSESGRVSVFVGYDPTGKFLEWDTFLDIEENETLLRYLEQEPP